MSENGGAYFPVRAGFCRDRAARALRRRHGWEGVGRYVGLLCMLLEEPGNALDVSTYDGMDDLAEQLGMGRDECSALLADMADAGLVDADAIRDGAVRAPVVDDAIDKWDSIIEAKRAAGRASGEARRKRAEEQSKSKARTDAEHVLKQSSFAVEQLNK